MYLSGCIRELRHPMLGYMFTERMGNAIPPDVTWAADNGRFAAPQDYTDEKYLRWLSEWDASRCLFATAPDVVADHAATVALSAPLFAKIRAVGYKPAFVAQDGWESATTPWDEFDVFFIGGTTPFKLSCGDAIAEARRRGKWVHMGRVNSFGRLRVAAAIGCDSADGTFLKYGPDVNEPRLLRWLNQLHSSPMLAA